VHYTSGGKDYCEWDLRTLMPLLRDQKILEDDRFYKIYRRQRYMQDRVASGGGMPTACCYRVVEQYFDAIGQWPASLSDQPVAEVEPKPAAKLKKVTA
jgi:hypothetical protein